MTSTLAQFDQLGGEAAAAVALVAGLVMWIIGRKLVKPAHVLLFASFGAAIGFFGPHAIGLDLSPALGLGVGLTLGALMGLLLFRMSMALSLAAALGVACPLVADVAMRIRPSLFAAPGAETHAPLSAEESLLPDVPINNDLKTYFGENPLAAAPMPGEGTVHWLDQYPLGSLDDIKEAVKAHAESEGAERVGRFVRELAQEAGQDWSALPERQRLILLACAGLGALVGFGAGLTRPKHVAAIGTAFTGAAVWIPAAAMLAKAHDLPGAAQLPSSAIAWLAMWLAISAIGAVIQVMSLRPKADKNAE